MNISIEEAQLTLNVLGNVCRQTAHLVAITPELVDLVAKIEDYVVTSAAVDAEVEEALAKISAEEAPAEEPAAE